MSRTEQHRLGREVLEARRDKVPWKVLEARHGYCRARLWQFMEAARKYERRVYKHLSAGQGRRAAS